MESGKWRGFRTNEKICQYVDQVLLGEDTFLRSWVTMCPKLTRAGIPVGELKPRRSQGQGSSSFQVQKWMEEASKREGSLPAADSALPLEEQTLQRTLRFVTLSVYFPLGQMGAGVTMSLLQTSQGC